MGLVPNAHPHHLLARGLPEQAAGDDLPPFLGRAYQELGGDGQLQWHPQGADGGAPVPAAGWKRRISVSA